jgi:hypothetical protein
MTVEPGLQRSVEAALESMNMGRFCAWRAAASSGLSAASARASSRLGSGWPAFWVCCDGGGVLLRGAGCKASIWRPGCRCCATTNASSCRPPLMLKGRSTICMDCRPVRRERLGAHRSGVSRLGDEGFEQGRIFRMPAWQRGLEARADWLDAFTRGHQHRLAEKPLIVSMCHNGQCMVVDRSPQP